MVKILEMSNGEFYSMRDLKHQRHGLVYGVDRTQYPKHGFLEIPVDASYADEDFTVLRMDHSLFRKWFTTLKIPFGPMIRFVLKHGKACGQRDAGGRRIDFGCAGQHYEVDRSTGRHTGKPADIVGIHKLFPPAESGTSGLTQEERCLQYSFGKIFDAVQGCLDELLPAMGVERCFNNPYREEYYAAKFRREVKGETFRFEWATVQVKCLSRRHVTKEHKDKQNCDQRGYDRTNTLCYTIRDKEKQIWSIKFILNSRQKIGNYMKSLAKIKGPVMDNIRAFVEVLKNKYQEFQGSYGINLDGGDAWPEEAETLEWDKPERVFIDGNIPYLRWEDGKSITVDYVELPAAISRDTWLSPYVNWLYDLRHGVETMSEENQILYRVISCYQNSPFYFWTSMKSLKEKNKGEWPAPDHYEDTCREMFGGWVGGPRKRFNPTRIKSFNEMMYNGEKGKLRREAFLRELKILLAWVETEGDTCSTDGYKQRLIQTKNELNKSFAEIDPTFTSPDFGEFRLTLFVQMSLLTGCLKSGFGVIENIYPVQDLGSYKHLVDLGGVDPKNVELAMRMIGEEIGIIPYRAARVECILCESVPKRSHIRDILFKYSDLFMLLPRGDGRMWPHRKAYGTYKYLPIELGGDSGVITG